MPIVLVDWIDPMTGQRRHDQFSLPLLIGREAACDLPLSDPEVSRRHAEIRQEHEQIVLVDLESMNGTWVDGRRIARTALLSPMSIRIGAAALTVTLAPAPDRACDSISPRFRSEPLAVLGRGRGAITHVAPSPDGSLLAVASAAGLALYDGTTFAERGRAEFPYRPDELYCTNGSVLIVAHADRGLECVTVRRPGVEHTTIAHDVLVPNFAISPDAALVALDHGESVQVVRVTDQTPLHSLAVDTARPYQCLVFDPTGEKLAAITDDGVQLWGVAEGLLQRRISMQRAVERVCFAPDGAILAMATRDGVTLWDVQSGTHLGELRVKPDGPWNGLRFAPDGERLALAWGPHLQIWRVRDGALMRAEQCDEPLVSIAFGATSEVIVAATHDALWLCET